MEPAPWLPPDDVLLPVDLRRGRGQFSTPARLVRFVLSCAGYTATADLRQVRLLDPACGMGNFLLVALDRLLHAAKQERWPVDDARTAIARNLWGFEVDPASCTLAELRLRAMLPPELISVPLHLHQVDALALKPAEAFDIVVSNPPYLSARRCDLSAYRWLLGQRDAYLLFVDLACRLVKRGGVVGVVLPDPFLARANAREIRQHLLADFTLRRLLHIEGVFPAYVGTVVLVARREPAPPGQRVSWARLRVSGCQAPSRGGAAMEHVTGLRRGTAPQAVFMEQPQSALRYLLDERIAALMERITAGGGSVARRLRDLVRISRGEELAKYSAWLMDRPGPGRLPVLRGGSEIRPFAIQFRDTYLPVTCVRKPWRRYQSAKLLVVKSTDRLVAALDTQGYVALQTLYLLHPRGDEADLFVVLALLNARLLRAYLRLTHTRYKLVQPQIEQHVLGDLPLPALADADVRALRYLAQQLHEGYRELECRERGSVVAARYACSEGIHCDLGGQRVEWKIRANSLEAELNTLVSHLYGVTEAELALLESAAGSW